MMTPALFTFQIILLVVGLGIGYLLLIKANAQENELKKIGRTIGWVLISATIVLEILSLSYSVVIINKYSEPHYFPVDSTGATQQQYIREGGIPEVVPASEGDSQEPGVEGRPIKNQDTNTIP